MNGWARLVGGLVLALAVQGPARAVEFHVFGDVSVNSGDLEQENVSFALGALDLFGVYQVSDETRSTIELIFDDPGQGEFVSSVERLSVEHRFSDGFRFAAGRFHTPLGFWNYNYHHGALIQDTVSRPFFLSFEEQHEGIFPLHLVGIQIRGQVPLSDANGAAWQYQFAVGNGPTIDTSVQGEHGAEIDTNNVVDYNDDKMILVRMAWGDFVKGNHLGLFALRNDLVEAGLDPAQNLSGRARGEKLYYQYIAGLDSRVALGPLSLMGEYFFIRTTDNIPNPAITADPGSHNSQAYYVQATWHLTDRFAATARRAQNRFSAGDSYYRLLAVEQEVQHVLALRYNIQESNAVRLEFNQERAEDGHNRLGVTLQWFFLLF